MVIYDNIFDDLKEFKLTKEDLIRVEHISTTAGSGFSGYHHTDEAKEKIRAAAKLPRKPHTEERKRNIAASKIGKSFSHSEEAKIKISKASSSRVYSEEARRNMSIAARNRKKRLPQE